MFASFAVFAFLACAGHGIRMQVKLDGSRESSHDETKLLAAAKHKTQEQSVSLADSEAHSTLLTQIRSPWKALVMLIATLSALSPAAGVVGGGREMIPSADAPTRQVVDLWSNSGPLDSTFGNSGPLDTTFGSDLEAAGAGFFGGYEASKDADWGKIEADHKEEEQKEVEASWRRHVEAKLDEGLKSLASLEKRAAGKVREKTVEMVDLVVGAGLHQILKMVGDKMHKAAVNGDKIETTAFTLQLDKLKPGHTAAHDIRMRLNHDVYQLEINGLEIDVNLGISELKAVGMEFVVQHFGKGALDNMEDLNILAKVRGGVDIGFYHDQDGTWQPQVHFDGQHRPPNLSIDIESIEYRGRKYDIIKKRANGLLHMADKPLKGLVQHLIEDTLRDLTYSDKWYSKLILKALNLQYSLVKKLGFGHNLLVDHEGEECSSKGINFCGGGICHKEGEGHVCRAAVPKKKTIEDMPVVDLIGLTA